MSKTNDNQNNRILCRTCIGLLIIPKEAMKNCTASRCSARCFGIQTAKYINPEQKALVKLSHSLTPTKEISRISCIGRTKLYYTNDEGIMPITTGIKYIQIETKAPDTSSGSSLIHSKRGKNTSNTSRSVQSQQIYNDIIVSKLRKLTFESGKKTAKIIEKSFENIPKILSKEFINKSYQNILTTAQRLPDIGHRSMQCTYKTLQSIIFERYYPLEQEQKISEKSAIFKK